MERERGRLGGRLMIVVLGFSLFFILSLGLFFFLSPSLE